MILVGDMRLLPYFMCGRLLPGLSGSLTLVIQGLYEEVRRGLLEQKIIALDQTRHRVTRLTRFLPTHCSHNGNRKRDM